jgi:hypothetical protein
MRKLILTLFASSLLFSCTNTKLTVSWTQENIVAKKYNNIGVSVLLPHDGNRLVVEEALAAEFKKRGINASITFYKFPLAGRKDIIQNLNLTDEELKNGIVKKIKENKIDALLTVTIFNTKTEERYVSRQVGFTPYYDHTMPMYNRTYYDYYSYLYHTTYAKGYYETDATYFIETNLYDVESEKLQWTAQSETKNMNSVEEEAIVFSRIIVKDIIEKNVVIVK